MAIVGSLEGERRRAELVVLAQGDEGVSIDGAAARFGVSAMTIRRDLADLEVEGLVRRVRGGAVAAPDPRSYGDRLVTREGAKRVIAQKVLELVPVRGTVAFDASTTTNAIAATLSARDGLIAITNSIETFAALGSLPGVHAQLTGGTREPETGSLIGPIANLGARAVQAELFLASAAGLHPASGSSEVSLEEAEVKRHFAANASQTVLCVDSSKLDKRSPGGALALDEIAVLVTELDPADARLDAYRSQVRIL